jgi:uncharacterized membrane protein
MGSDLMLVLRWWIVWLLMGLVGWPLVQRVFSKWEDKGYLMAKIVGAASVTFIIWWLGSWKLLPFSVWGILLSAAGILVTAWILQKPGGKPKMNWALIITEEVGFLALLLFWSWIKAHEPSINGLEKFMDFGFTQSILRGNYFPPTDMWFAGEPINYYYFGHLMLAMTTRLSGIDLTYTFNLILATLFALCATMSFGIARQLLKDTPRVWKIGGAFFTAFLVTLSGNLQTIYAFTKGYSGDAPIPFWQIWSDFSSWNSIKQGWNSYWYPNATRFIPFTVHEFPSYSFVVSDIHGHVLDIPLALLVIAMLIIMFEDEKKKLSLWMVGLYGWILGLMLMTNALDGPVYMALWGILVVSRARVTDWKNRNWWKEKAVELGVLLGTFLLTIMPFVAHFQPFVSGIGVDCPPQFLANSKHGPFLFEGVEKCQKSPIWMMLLLWGFFVYGAWGLTKVEVKEKKMLIVMSLFCLGLIIFPEFFYFKDIYPAHFRSNTMFKLGYQVFMIMSLITGMVLTRAVWKLKKHKWYVIAAIPLVFLVSIYPNFGVKSYFGDLKTYRGLYGLSWLSEQYPGDYQVVRWLNKNIPMGEQPVVLEANGDSYTNYERVSTFTGLPTIAGWVVHEWLWRGSYDPIAKRAEEVKTVYESDDANYTRLILDKYSVKYIVVGEMEREKYSQLNETKIQSLATPVFSAGDVVLYKVN